MLKKQAQRKRRHGRVRAKISGTSKIPRLCVFRSNKYIYAQLVDDETGKIIAQSHGSKTLKDSSNVGESIAKHASENKITRVLFDRGGYKYHGRVKALAESARKGGLKF